MFNFSWFQSLHITIKGPNAKANVLTSRHFTLTLNLVNLIYIHTDFSYDNDNHNWHTIEIISQANRHGICPKFYTAGFSG